MGNLTFRKRMQNCKKKITKTSSEFLRGLGFPDSSVGKESTCNAGDSGLIPGWGKSAGGGIGYPLHHSWASLVAQMIKNPSAMWESWVWSLGWNTPVFSPREFHGQYSPWGHKELDRTEWISFSLWAKQSYET